MKKIILTFILILIATTCFAETNFIDECSDFSQVVNKTDNLIPQPGDGNMQGDETVIQRAGNFNDQWLEYKIDYCDTVIVSTYFYYRENIVDFTFSATDILGEEVILNTEKEVFQKSGFWTKVDYKISAKDKEILLLKINFPNIDFANNTSWAQALGKICATKKAPIVYFSKIDGPSVLAIPRNGFETGTYVGNRYDQAGNKMEVISLTATKLPNGVTFDSETGVVTVTVDAVENESLEISADNQYKKNVLLSCLELGDVNADRIIDKNDFEIAVSGYLQDNNSLNWFNFNRADINNNGIIDIYDIAFVSKLAQEVE